MMKEIPTSYQPETYADLNNQLKGLTEDLHSTKESKEQITQRCHELDMQVNIIKNLFEVSDGLREMRNQLSLMLYDKQSDIKSKI